MAFHLGTMGRGKRERRFDWFSRQIIRDQEEICKRHCEDWSIRNIPRLVSSTAISGALLLAAATANAASIGSSLADAMRAAGAGEKIGILVELRARANTDSAVAGVVPGDWDARSAAVIGALPATAGRTQQGLRDYLDAQEAAGTDAPSELIHDDEHPVGLAQNRFTAK